jgi:hypothetical protein
MTHLATTSPGTRSCVACSKAKRRCDKKSPACRRCSAKRQDCTYPPANPSCFVPLHSPPEALSPELELLPISLDSLLDPQALEWSAFDDDLQLSSFLAPLGPGTELSVTESTVHGLYGAWFLSPETWVVDHTSIPLPPNFELSDLKGVFLLIQEWLKTWVVTGSNNFIHAKLYRDKFPACIQIAYTTLAAYVNRGPGNTDMILRIVNERAKELVGMIKATPARSLDVFEHLAHVQALFVYQTIGLLDGDIRSRHLAEQRSPTFIRLLNDMLENASTGLPQLLAGWEFDEIMTSQPDHSGAIKRVWHAWIVSESMRRTWLVGMALHAAYDGLKQGWTPCAGDIAFTGCAGLWAAPSADAWDKLCAETNVRPLHRFHAACLFQDGDPDDVDNFGKTMLEITYGKERMQEWLHKGQG